MGDYVGKGAKIFLALNLEEQVGVILFSISAVAAFASYIYTPAGDFHRSMKGALNPFKVIKIIKGDSTAEKMGLLIGLISYGIVIHKAFPHIRRYALIALSIRS